MKTKKLKSAERVQDADERMYHIGVRPRDIAPLILLCGDVNRPARVAERFSKVTYQGENREFKTFTGLFRGTPITAMSSGIGPSCIEIVMSELAEIVDDPIVIRVGTCGGFQKHVRVGDLAITAASYRMEDTSLKMVDPGYPAHSDYRVIQALVAAASRLKMRHHVGITATSSGFFAGQGRSVGGFEPRESDFVARLERLNVINCEMESSTLLTMANLKRWRAGCVCAVVADRIRNEFIDPKGYRTAEATAIDAALEAIQSMNGN